MNLIPSILIPIPRYGFDPTEVAIPWRYLKAQHFKIVFATPDATQAHADSRMLTGEELGIFKKILIADKNGRNAYRELEQTHEFQHPISYQDIRINDFTALFLPGGHDKGMREYLESPLIQKVVADFFDENKPVGAICHGTLVVGRSISKRTNRSVLWGRKTTGLTRRQELAAYHLTRFYLGDYYRTYPITVEDELRSFLKDENDFIRGPEFIMPLKRDNTDHLEIGFTVRDKNYLSARWPGDAHRFSTELVALIRETDNRANT